MLSVSLEEIIKKAIEELNSGKINDRVETFVDYKSKYAILKPSVKVEINLCKGVTAKLDISDLFKEELK